MFAVDPQGRMRISMRMAKRFSMTTCSRRDAQVRRACPRIRVPGGAGGARSRENTFLQASAQVRAPARRWAMSVRHTRHRRRSAYSGAISSWRVSASIAWAHGVQTDQARPRFRAFSAMTLQQHRHLSLFRTPEMTAFRSADVAGAAPVCVRTVAKCSHSHPSSPRPGGDIDSIRATVSAPRPPARPREWRQSRSASAPTRTAKASST